MNAEQNKVLSMAQIGLSEQTIDEQILVEHVNKLGEMYNLSENEKVEVIKELQVRMAIKMDSGVVIKEKNHTPWYNYAKRNIKSTFHDRYRLFLMKENGFSKQVVDKLDGVTDEIMDLIGNPKSQNGFSRKGLVIGDVQSGKTSTYISLINKAADAGYKVIILLTGTIEKLRKQTQERLDYGFIGIDSKVFMEENKNSDVGVGKYARGVHGIAFTSTRSDFNLNSSKQIITRLSGMNAPVLFVLKKNKSVLENLERWLKNSADNGSVVKFPMLLIDDEADNASVNTKKEGEDPSAINACIRKLLELFEQSSYVAFTATPYANIFINPDSNEEMINEDLFPKHFIYALVAPSNYIGATSIFDSDGKYNFMLKTNDDCEDYLPEKHKKDYEPGELPKSLKEAIASFFIGNAVRDLRGQTKKHRTMLVNISRFINVQNKIKDTLNGYVKEIQREVRNYSRMGKLALKHEHIKFIYDVYNRYFTTLTQEEVDGEETFSWDDILRALDNAISPIVVRSINGGNASNYLNYDESIDGLRLIAVGGFSLSRGLTLEGLMVSYFYRNSKMYDTLMQMGRWFGYRPHYADVCQVWMSSDSQGWYEYISMATEELKRDVKKMMNSGNTPEEFGLGVRSDINSLIVTAANKMRYTQNIPVNISFSGTVTETPYLFSSNDKCESNYNAVSSWLDEIIDNGCEVIQNENMALKGCPQILNVNKNDIISLLQRYECHPFNFNFQSEEIIKTIQSADDKLLDKWDVVIATGSIEDEIDIGKYIRNINPVKRSFRIIKREIGALQMSGSKSRLGSANFAKGGLTAKEAKKIEDKLRMQKSPEELDKAFSQNDYFSNILRKPLLIIYPVGLNVEAKNEDQEIRDAKERMKKSILKPLIGLAVGIPNPEGKKKIALQYTINLVKWRDIIGVDDDFIEESGEDDGND